MRGAITLVIVCGCFGTLGQRGHRAPPGLAYCEPRAIELQTGDRTLRLSCDPFGHVTVRDTDGYVATADLEDAEALWDLVARAAPLRSCAGPGRRYLLRFYGDDGIVEHADCPLGGDDDFDRVLGAVLQIRHPPAVRWMDLTARRSAPPSSPWASR